LEGWNHLASEFHIHACRGKKGIAWHFCTDLPPPPKKLRVAAANTGGGQLSCRLRELKGRANVPSRPPTGRLSPDNLGRARTPGQLRGLTTSDGQDPLMTSHTTPEEGPIPHKRVGRTLVRGQRDGVEPHGKGSLPHRAFGCGALRCRGRGPIRGSGVVRVCVCVCVCVCVGFL